jgi:hypothetical protein
MTSWCTVSCCTVLFAEQNGSSYYLLPGVNDLFSRRSSAPREITHGGMFFGECLCPSFHCSQGGHSMARNIFKDYVPSLKTWATLLFALLV